MRAFVAEQLIVEFRDTQKAPFGFFASVDGHVVRHFSKGAHRYQSGDDKYDIENRSDNASYKHD